MGMLKEMFSEGQDDSFQKREPVPLAKAKYKNSAEMILSGYKTFQKKYVYKKVFLKMLLVVIAIVSSVLMLITSESGDVRPIVMIALCVVIGVYFISQPIKNRNEVKRSAEKLDGSEYDIEITDQTIKITMPKMPQFMTGTAKQPNCPRSRKKPLPKTMTAMLPKRKKAKRTRTKLPLQRSFTLTAQSISSTEEICSF